MDNDFILVLDLGGPEAVSMARKLRNQRCYTEILSGRADTELLQRKSPRGILIAGGEDGAGEFPREALSLGIPVLALGGAARMLAMAEGAAPEGTQLMGSVAQITFQPCDLFDGLSISDRYLTRVDGYQLPAGYRPIATTLDGLVPAFADFDRKLYALQFYAESNDPDGAAILSNFAEKICGCTPFWTMESYIDREVDYIRERVGEGRALLALSGGVDSTACALLLRRAIGDRLTCVFIDNGMLREGEAAAVLALCRDTLDLSPVHVDASERFLERLKGVTDPREKRRAMRSEFIAVLNEVFDSLPDAKFIVQGTIYSDLLEGFGPLGARSIPEDRLVEPLRMLFKDEVRELATKLGMPREIVERQPFPSAGLALRCCGEVTREKLNLLRQADAIFREEVVAAGQEKRLSRYFAVLTDTPAMLKNAGEYAPALVLRAVSGQGAGFAVGKLPYDLLDRVTRRVAEELPGVGRVAYDITGSELAAVEWE